ncbi:MAG: tRNA (N6-isopentenyl adenosine(37)-C2)-methylthiotransferase MiaB [Bacillota bacterium]
MCTPKKYLVSTFGCQMNDHDSEVMAGLLEGMGYLPAGEGAEPDIILINTCCVRETAENKVFGLLGRLRRVKEARPETIIGVGGCMVQQYETARRIKLRFPHVDLIFGTHNLPELPRMVRQVAEGRGRVFEVLPEGCEVVENLPRRRVPGLKAWVAIMYGCNNFCTYCIVPHVRGRERSRQPGDILGEVKRLVAEGCREVTLLGQNVNSYGKELAGGYDFAGLLELLEEEVEDLERVRFMTSHPRDFSDRLIKVMAGLNKVCEHIHLPVQAGSTRVLQLMNRGYSREDYLGLVERIKTALPGVSLTTDIIVGFPGETEDDFRQTVDLVQRVGYDSAYTFVYNKRTGTPAAKMDMQVDDQIKSRRIQELIQIQNAIAVNKNQAEEGRALEVLVEGVSKGNEDRYSGRTRTNKLVVFPGCPELVGKTLPVKIIKGTLTHLEGKLGGQ